MTYVDSVNVFLPVSDTSSLLTVDLFETSVDAQTSQSDAHHLVQTSSSIYDYNVTDVTSSDVIIGVTPLVVVFTVLLSALILGIIAGNALVIVSVACFSKMRTLSNGLIASLASADLLVALVVLPISLQYEVTGEWTLGSHICDIWITSDVFCCTASILNIVVIALDRLVYILNIVINALDWLT